MMLRMQLATFRGYREKKKKSIVEPMTNRRLAKSPPQLKD
jgi:hypothetical protein